MAHSIIPWAVDHGGQAARPGNGSTIYDHSLILALNQMFRLRPLEILFHFTFSRPINHFRKKRCKM